MTRIIFQNKDFKQVSYYGSQKVNSEIKSILAIKTVLTGFLCLFAICCFHSNVHAQFLHELDKELKPWTYEPVIGESYRFVIIGDLTGGEIPGLFDQAVEKINKLAPDFVVPVGDLIEGYTLDRGLAGEYWDRFNNSLEKLESPFFYVPGNHDVTNELLLDEWKKRYGYDYYSFNAGNVLFIVLNTAVPGASGFPQKQLDYVEAVLNDHPEGDPVFVFSHHPLFSMFESGREGYRDLEKLLIDKEVTCFSGHWHRYLHVTHNDQAHYNPAGVATGRRRGVNLGEFLNIMFVTVTPEKITVANLDLEGIIPLSIVDEESLTQVNAIGSNWAGINPTVIETEKGVYFSSGLTLHNRGEYPLQISGGFNPVGDFIMCPEELEVVLPPNSSKDISVSLNTIKPHSVKDLPYIEMQFDGRFLQEGKDISASNTARWIIDNWKRSRKKSADPSFTEKLTPGAFQSGWDWDGIDDGSFAYRVMHDNDFVYIEIKTFDDKVIFGDEFESQDKLTILFNPDTTFNNTDYVQFEFVPERDEDIVLPSDARYDSVEADYSLKGNSIIGSLKIPRELLHGNYFRMNFAFMDVDDPRQLYHSVFWWKPIWGSGSDYPQSGIFIIED